MYDLCLFCRVGFHDRVSSSSHIERSKEGICLVSRNVWMEKNTAPTFTVGNRTLQPTLTYPLSGRQREMETTVYFYSIESWPIIGPIDGLMNWIPTVFGSYHHFFLGDLDHHPDSLVPTWQKPGGWQDGVECNMYVVWVVCVCGVRHC